jgi:NitT/TauT family transport system substrate-binding protein
VNIYKIAWRAAVVAAAVVMSLTGCTSIDNAPGPAGPPERSTIVVDSVPAAEEGGLYIAAVNGFFQQQGLTVKINSITGGEEGIPDLQSGKAQFVGGNYVSFVLAQIDGRANGKPADFRIVAPASQIQPGSNALYVLPDSPYRTVASLASHHASIGLNTPRDVGQVLLGALMQDNGYAIGDIHQVIPPGGFPAVMAMLKRGQVEAAWLPQPLGTMVQQQYGAVQLADFDQGPVQNLPFTGYIASAGWARQHPNTVAAFTRAIAEGQRVADSNRGALETAMERYTGLQPLIADTMPFDTYPLTMADAELQRVSNAMYEFGLTPSLSKPYEISKMIGS